MPRSKRAGGISTFSFEVPSAGEGRTYEDGYLLSQVTCMGGNVVKSLRTVPLKLSAKRAPLRTCSLRASASETIPLRCRVSMIASMHAFVNASMKALRNAAVHASSESLYECLYECFCERLHERFRD